MFFILSKILYVLILPLTWVFTLLAYVIFAKNHKIKQRGLVSAFIIFWFFGNQFTANAIANMWDVAPYQPSAKTYSTVIVLGGFISEDKNGKGYFNGAVGRFKTATALIANGTAKHILFSGGNADLNPDGFSEATFVGEQLRKLNIADSLILLDGKARNTLENTANAKKLLQKANLKPPYLLVTSAYHMRRARHIFEKAGLDVVAYPCDYAPKGVIMPTSFVPGEEAFGKWNLYIKEMIGYIVTGLK
ncbi:YdcF family protein [Mucilaginibacter aquariorum]|uniref:YdcF family protein n=1 Tax=Mucilaginibacter aquariorum TaxID=2967225 RepID=A0ABT1T9B9_9SPHI|nr:YdcF family protein [Mucilaginibacter aquariorum]MCQ6961218.1 YdcF family protein [Mucilaginibacter aquariorum]